MGLFQPKDDELLHTKQWSDNDRRSFLQNLDEAAGHEVEVSDWEAEFIDSNLKPGVENPTYSPKQRKVIEDLYIKYNDSL